MSARNAISGADAVITIWSLIIDYILSAGRVLSDVDVRNWALDSQQALNALAEMRKKSIGVLGGDVYWDSGNGVEPKYDNWYCDRAKGESCEELAIRSIDIAEKYISAYPNMENQILFAPIPLVGREEGTSY